MKSFINKHVLWGIMDIRLLKEVIQEQKKDFEKTEGYVKREALHTIQRYLKMPLAIIITGMRRSGKSTLLKEIKDAFFRDKNVYYLNFDSEKLVDFTVHDFNALYEECALP